MLHKVISTSGLTIDFETRSDVDIRKRGAYVYFDSRLTAPLMASYQINDGPLKRWRPPAPCPDDIRAHVEAGGIVSAHNASFERLLWQKVLTPRYGWPVLATEQCRCTAATAAAMALPRSLADLGAALDLPIQKSLNGQKLINWFSKPRRSHKDEIIGRLYFNEPHESPERFEQFHDYCDDDVRTEALADRRMVPLSEYEQKLWVIDQRINDRGVRIDRRSAIAAQRLAKKTKQQLDREMHAVTGGAVANCNQPGKLVAWVREQDVPMGGATKAEIEELLELEDLPSPVRRTLELRQEAAKTSVAKLASFLARASADNRVRGAFLFSAAGTGRWSSVGAQIHNLPRPRREFNEAHLDLATLFDAFRSSDPEWLKTLYGDRLGRPLHLISDAIRGFIWAAPGHDLIAADYSGIEGAVAAWLAGEDWKVQAMHELIANPELPDLYRRAAARIFNTTTEQVTKKDPRRQVGKVAELSLQYQSGVAGLTAMARGYSVKLDSVFDPVWDAAAEEQREWAERRYEECSKRGEQTTKDLTWEGWMAAELVKIGWRATNPMIVNAWRLLEDAIKEAIGNPGHQVSVLKCSYLVSRGFLWCKLPSGRCLAYGTPQVRAVEVPWADRTLPEEKRETKPTPTALGVNSVTKKWERFALYGGLAFENLVQAIARDILANGIVQAEARGYPVVAHVHDEIITELPKGEGDLDAFAKLICTLPEWAAGLPLSASGWRGKRYRKD